MSEYVAEIIWQRGSQKFSDNRYSRAHEWHFDGGVMVPASSSPQVVPEPYSAASHVDPEEAFVASIASCHMLFFLSLAAKKKWLIDEYRDTPAGIMESDATGAISMTKVTLRPQLVFGKSRLPSKDLVSAMHKQAHQMCFIANSVKTQIVVEMG